MTKSSKLLIHENPLMVLPSLAKAIGINEAIFLQQLHWLMEHPRSGIMHDGRKWIWRTYAEWQTELQWMAERTIKAIVEKLRDEGLILTAFLAHDQRDRTLYYTVDYDALDGLGMQKAEMHSADSALSIVQPVSSLHSADSALSTYTETTTETTSREGSATRRPRPPLEAPEPLKSQPKPPRKKAEYLEWNSVKAYLDATGRKWCDKQTAQYINEEADNAQKWAGVVAEWVAKGFNPTNISGMLDVYHNGWREPKQTRPAVNTVQSKTEEFMRALRERQAANAPSVWAVGGQS